MALYIKLMEGWENHLSYFYLKQHNRRAAFWFVFVCLLRQYQIQSRLTWTSVYIELLILQLLFPSAETTDVRLHTYTAAHVSCVYMCGREYTCTCTGEKTTSCVIRYHLSFPSWDRKHTLLLVCQSLRRLRWLPREPREPPVSALPALGFQVQTTGLGFCHTHPGDETQDLVHVNNWAISSALNGIFFLSRFLDYSVLMLSLIPAILISRGSKHHYLVSNFTPFRSQP